MEILKILQLGKFYPVRGGVEKVMYDLMTGLSGVAWTATCCAPCRRAARVP